MAQAADKDSGSMTGAVRKVSKRTRPATTFRPMDKIAAHLAAARQLAEAHPDADLHYLLNDALMYVGQQTSELDGQPANGSSAD